MFYFSMNKTKNGLQTLPRSDLVRSSVHWRFGSGVDIPLAKKITARTPTFRPRSFRRSLALRFGSPSQGQRGLCQATTLAARNLRTFTESSRASPAGTCSELRSPPSPLPQDPPSRRAGLAPVDATRRGTRAGRQFAQTEGF